MIKKIVIALLIVVFLFGFYKLTSKKPTVPPTNVADSNSADMIVYWGIGCPHCENVKKYVTENKIDSKLKLSWKEVYQDKNNQADMAKTAQKCPEIDTSKGMGVPFGFDTKNQKCYVGDEPIINWMSDRVSGK